MGCYSRSSQCQWGPDTLRYASPPDTLQPADKASFEASAYAPPPDTQQPSHTAQAGDRPLAGRVPRDAVTMATLFLIFVFLSACFTHAASVIGLIRPTLPEARNRSVKMLIVIGCALAVRGKI